KENLSIKIKPNNLAYIIYTSGSTGRPKGVMVEHQAVLDHCFGLIKSAGLQECKSFALFAPLVFDAGHAIIFSSLFLGASLNVLSREQVTDGEKLAKYLQAHPVDCIKIVPSVWLSYAGENNRVLAEKVMIFGGEAFSGKIPGYLKKAEYGGKVYNHYGPTEAAIGKTIHEVNIEKTYTTVPIGKPFSNTRLYVVSQEGRLVPMGVAGELYIAGEGLARGYLNQAELTKEKFIEDLFSTKAGSKAYKTGDKARWNKEGEIEYLGRIDEQVKIRGHRIELGEIENVLLQVAGVKEGTIAAIEDGNGNRQLAGYVVPEGGEGTIDREAIITQLRSKLPEYMIPAVWVEMKEMPLTSNGKINKKALPKPDTSELGSKTYTAPTNETEQKLSDIWQELLGIDKIGIHDNFFEKGGDSILTIQVVSRARRLGYELHPKDIFLHQTIEKLAIVIKERSTAIVSGEQGILTGSSGLLPIQARYLQGEHLDISHFNQSVLLKIDKGVTEATLQQACDKLITQHDALRFRYFQKEEKWYQEYGDSLPKVISKNIPIEADTQNNLWVTEVADKYQRSLDIENGDLIRVLLLQTSSEEKQNRLFIVIHHLVIDGISWRILLEDLEQLISDISTGKAKNLGNKSSSYRQWFDVLAKYGQSETALSQVKYWQNIIGNNYHLPVDKDYDGLVKVKDTDHYSQRLGKDQTQQLLQEVSGAYNTEINDILLSALGITISNWAKADKVIIGLEGHGREEIGDDVDISRTVGWFTNLYPVLLKINPVKPETGDVIKSVKEQLRQLPAKGIGYGVLKYINQEEALQGKDPWEIQFNYLGQVDNVIRESKWFSGANESAGLGRSEELILNEKMAVNCIVRGGELVIDWTFSNKHFEEETIQKLLSDYISNLELLIAHCAETAKKETFHTPSDYGLGSQISYEEFDDFLNEKISDGVIRREVLESIYPLSGLQEGMMFHTLYDGKVSAYKEQFECELVGADIEIFTKSWEQIVKRHSILRTAFYNDKFNIPVQCVYKEVALPMELLDYSAMPADEMSSAIKEYKKTERERGLDFKSAPLMRIAMMRLPNDRYKMIWTYHHIISDGWSMAVLMEEFLKTYELLSDRQSLEIKQPDNYEEYIRYIERVDKNEEQAYWKNYLKNIESGTLLPFIDKTSELTKGVGTYDSVYIKLDIEKARQVQDFVRDSHLTVNTLMQGVWSYLLHAYTGNDDVVYGVIVSGRPDDLPNIEHRVGMYINTLPLHSHFNKESDVKRWLTNLQNEQVSSRQYQYSSLSAIKSWAHIPAEFFDSILIFENYPINKVLGEKKWKLQVNGFSVNEQTNYPLNIVIGSAEEIHIRFSYNAKLLDKEYVQKISNHFENVLNQIIQNGSNTLGEINLITESEKDQILLDFNNAKANYPKDKNVVELFEEQASNTPGNIAAIFEEESLTYDELNKRSNQVAAWLRSKGVKENTLVPICIDRSFEMITGILGILKAGAAYVPIDPEYPEDRINYILEDTSARFIVTNAATAQKLSKNSNLSILELDTEANKISAQPDKNLNLNIAPHSLAYVIYTSGSTGKPKGVMIERASVVNLGLSQAAALRLKPKMATLQFASFGFDASCYEIFNTFLSGGTLVLPKKEDLLSASLFEMVVSKNNVEVAVLPPSFQHVIKDAFGTIKTIVSAGEPLNEEISKHFQSKGVRVINAYGPTENTVCSSLTDDPIKDNHRVVIGKPVVNTQVYILDKAGALQPAGVPGEMCLAGMQVARGYLNLPTLTQEKFIKDSFSKEQNARMYRSGDLARWLPDGNIEYLGRLDDQVKIRGYRIELGEIESVLLQSDLVSQAVVLAKGDGGGGKRLVGYVSSGDKEFDPEEIISWLKTKLPEYMVPALWIKVDNFPLTPSGKIDRKSLPEVSVNELMKSEYVEPRNSLEERLARIWQELLKIEKIGVYDNFFELGGHSLMAMRLLTAIHKELGIEVLVIKDLFQFSTIDELSKYLEIKLDTEIQEQDAEEFELINL
ncbi:MAG: amino acid adenylation domain-containing protein, partial [Ginsengibacter sp.]